MATGAPSAIPARMTAKPTAKFSRCGPEDQIDRLQQVHLERRAREASHNESRLGCRRVMGHDFWSQGFVSLSLTATNFSCVAE